MNKTQNIVKNIISLAAGGLITRLLFISTELIIARSMGAEVFGQFSTALAYTTIAAFFINFGVDFYLVKGIAQNPDNSEWIFGNTLFIKVIYAIVIFVFMDLLAIRLKYSTETFLLIQILGLYNVALAFQETFAAFFQAIEKMGKIAFYRSIQMTVLICLVFIFLKNGIFICSVMYLLTGSIFTIIWFIDTIRHCHPRLELKKIVFIIKNSYIFGLAAILFMLNYRVDTVMLSVMKTEAEVGLYSAAYKFIDIFIKVPIIISMALLPTLFKYSTRKKDKVVTIYRITIRYIGLFGLPLATILFIFADPVINFVFGSDFAHSADALKILCWSLFFTFMASPASDQLNAANRQDLNLLGWAIVLIVNLTLNFILIPLYGILGASWATLISQALLFVVLSFFYWKISGINFVAIEIAKPFLATIAFSIPVYMLQNELGLLFGVLVSGIIFITVIILVKFFNTEDMIVIKSLMNKQKAET